jgi:hypothetical protein
MASAANLVANGEFDNGDGQSASQWLNATGGFIPSWTNGALYTLWIAPGQGDTTINGLYGLAGPKYGVDNGLTDTSPNGGNYVALDGDVAFRGTGLSQTVHGLVPGTTYTLSFEYAGAQEFSVTGANTESFQVTLGDQTFTTPVLDNCSQCFTGWQTYSTSFTYDGSGSDSLLTFLSVGTPSGGPPWALLDSVSLAPVPEPSTWAITALGFVGLGYARFRSKGRKAVATA